MTEKKRLLLLLAVVSLLVLANLATYTRSEGSAIFFESSAIEEASPELLKTIEEIEGSPALNFHIKKEQSAEHDQSRNPFIFGVDRAMELEQKRRMEELENARKQMEAARAAQAVQVEATAEPEVVKATFTGTILGLMQNTTSGEVLVSLLYKDEYRVLKPGDTLDETYKLLSADETHVRILAIASSQEIDISLETD